MNHLNRFICYFSLFFIFTSCGQEDNSTPNHEHPPSPTITKITPALVNHKDSTEVVIEGTNFQPGLQFSLNGIPLFSQLSSSSTLAAWLPAQIGLCGPMKLRIQNPSSLADSPDSFVENDQLFRYYTDSADFVPTSKIEGSGISQGAVVLGDFNNDQKPDLAFVDNNNGISISWGHEMGSFAPAVFVQKLPDPFGTLPDALMQTAVAGDFDQDGNIDLALLIQGPKYHFNSIWFLRGNGNGTFALSKPLTVTNQDNSFKFLAIANLNGDKHPDLLTVQQPTPRSYQLKTFLWDVTQGNFQESREQSKLNLKTKVTIAALLSIDLGVEDAAGVVVLGKNGNADYWIQPHLIHRDQRNTENFLQATILPHYMPPSNSSGAATIGDFNFDGIPDIAVVSVEGMRILLGTGAGGFQEQKRSYLSAEGSFVVAGDVNHDQKTDLVLLTDYGNMVNIFTNQCASE